MPKMRCPIEAVVSYDGKTIIDESKRCPEIGFVSYPDDKSLIVVKCPKHGEVQARADIWAGRVS